MLRILILQSYVSFAFLDSNVIYLCLQASKWKPINRSLTGRAWLSFKLEQTTDWREWHIRTNTCIIFKLKKRNALVSVFWCYWIKSLLWWLSLILLFYLFFIICFPLSVLPSWAVTWITIQLVGKSRVNYPDYQGLFTCKLVICHSLLHFITSHCQYNQWDHWPSSTLHLQASW